MIIWRRHVAPCESTDRTDPRCGCPIYQEYRVGNRRFRKTLKTRNWQKALADARRIELEGFTNKPKPSPVITEATEKFLADAQARDLKEASVDKFRLLFKHLQAFAADQGLVFMSDFDLDNLREFRATWKNQNESARVKLGNLKAFFRFSHEAGWIQTNHAAKIKPGKVIDPVIIPLTSEEFQKILKACDEHSRKKNAKRLRALVLVMRFTGLRIRDTVTLRRDSIQNGKLFLRTAKTGQDVWCPLPPEVIKALDNIPDLGDHPYYFWSGNSKPKAAVGDYQRALSLVFKEAGVPRAYPHLFRHTFATQLLQDGVSVQTVAALLGHSKTSMTEKRYSHWIKGRQENLELEVKKSWASLGSTHQAQKPERKRVLEIPRQKRTIPERTTKRASQ
jgi:integrase/recombinase XerD